MGLAKGLNANSEMIRRGVRQLRWFDQGGSPISVSDKVRRSVATVRFGGRSAIVAGSWTGGGRTWKVAVGRWLVGGCAIVEKYRWGWVWNWVVG
jgi:hypothetical protein